MAGTSWFDMEEDDDRADFWKPQEHFWKIEGEAKEHELYEKLRNTEVEKNKNKLFYASCIIDRAWNQFKFSFHALTVTPAEAFESRVDPDNVAALINASEYRLCDEECKNHSPARPEYLVDEKAIHIPEESAKRAKNAMQGFDLDTDPVAFYLYDCVAQSIHHQLNPEVFEQRKQGSLEDIEARMLIGCVERLARLSSFQRRPCEMPGTYRRESRLVRKYSKQLTKKPLSKIIASLQPDEHEVIGQGLGRIYANDLYEFERKCELYEQMSVSFGDGGVGTCADIMRIITPAQNLSEAVELLFQKAEGPKVNCVPKKEWPRFQTFYSAIAYELTGIHNVLEAASKKQS